jgi:16S rRNA (adenine1518-N6/adenine1519-N6)-dimethyltransferase
VKGAKVVHSAIASPVAVHRSFAHGHYTFPVQTLGEIRGLLASRGLTPRHRLGQNFLHDKNQVARLVEAAGLSPGECVLEVGPGTGTLTEALVEREAEVLACEIDRGLASILRERLGDRITLVEGDVLQRGRQLNDAVHRAIAGRPFKLIANLPYQVASPLMAALLIEHENCCGEFVTIQKEVAQRLAAAPRTKAYGPLSIIVQALAAVRLIGDISPMCFWPAPQVTSAMVAILPRGRAPGGGGAGAGPGALIEAWPAAPATVGERRELATFITRLFSGRRKQLGSILGRGPTARLPSGIEPGMRPEALTVAQIIGLWRAMHEAADRPLA